MKAFLILVGTELLNGAMLDTNSIYMAEELNLAGIEVVGKLSLPDSIESIKEGIEFAEKKGDLIILSGGLGPTEDDITKEAVAEYIKKELVVDLYHKDEMERKFKARGIDILSKNIKEVMVPKDSVVFKNEPGIAPAFLNGKISAFPGVPAELKNMFPKFINHIKKTYDINNEIYIRDLLVFGIPESILEERVKNTLSGKSFTLEFLVKDYGIIIRLLGKNKNKKEIDFGVEETKKILGYHLVSDQGKKPELCLLEKLKETKYNLKLAESCTGGMIASTLINLPGISEFLEESMVTYSNESKINRLGVKRETINTFGAVSRECVKEMLQGLKSDTAIAVSGIAGPGGGTKEKPVGTVYIGVRVKNNIDIKKYEIKGDREKVRIKSTYTALFNLLNILNNAERGMTKC